MFASTLKTIPQTSHIPPLLLKGLILSGSYLAAAGKPDLSPSNARSACLTAWQGGEAIELPAYTSDLPSLCQSEKIIEEIVNTA